MEIFQEYENYDALELAELIGKGDLSAEEVLEAAIERVEKRNPDLNAVVNKMYDQAREDIAAGLPEGPLKGVPFLLKDLGIHYKGVPTTYGSDLFKNFIPDHDSELVTRYKRAGLVIFGKTNTPEFGLTVSTEPRLFGPCRNPWDPERTSGGSSGGAAVSVASGMVPVAHASDGGGSIRIPASCCGLFGLKPTRGRVSPGPDVGEGWAGMSGNHVISRTVRDSAAFLDASAGPALGDPYWAQPPVRPFLDEVGKPPGKLKIAFTVESPTGFEVGPACIEAALDIAGLCEGLGHHVEEGFPPIDQGSLGSAVVNIINASTLAALESRAKELGRELSPEDVEKVTWRSAENGKSISALDYIGSVQTLHRTGRQVAEFFRNYDILLTPVLLKPPIPLGRLNMMTTDISQYVKDLSGFFGFTSLFNVTGQPAMSVPLYWTADGLPVGLQFAARYGEEELLFRLGAQLETARPWKAKRPALDG